MYASSSCWIDAAPFRAHVRQLMAAGALDVSDVATLSGLSRHLTCHLAHGRRGRPLRRLHVEAARQLMRIRVDHVRNLRDRRVPVEQVRELRERLLGRGWSDHAIAERIGCSTAALDDLTRPRGRCSLLLGVRLTALDHEALLSLPPGCCPAAPDRASARMAA